MKKNYMSPSIEVISFDNNQLLAGSEGKTSDYTGGSLNNEETTTPGARPNHGSLWD